MYVLLVYATSDGNDHDVYGPFATKKLAYDYLYANFDDEDPDDLDSDVLEVQPPVVKDDRPLVDVILDALKSMPQEQRDQIAAELRK